MSDILDQYAKQKPVSALDQLKSIGRPGERENRLLDRLAQMTQERLGELSHAGALTATTWSVTTLIDSLSVQMNVENTPGSWGFDENFCYRLFEQKRKPYRDGQFFSFACAARQAQLAVLGEEAFLERHWERLARHIRKTDALIRQKRGLPEPAGLLAWRERSALNSETAAPSPSAKGPRAL